MGLVSERQPDMGIVQVVWRADAHKIDLIIALPAQFIQMAVEAFGFEEKVSIGKVTVEDAHIIGLVEGCNQAVSGVVYGPEVARGDETRSTDQREIVCNAVFHLLNISRIAEPYISN
jgi:hypothetical protein